jgi:DNA-binding GntR family transcriptional regulator
LKASIEDGDAEWEGNLVAAHHKLRLMEERMISGDHSVKETWKRYDWEFHQAMIGACNSKNLLSLHSTIIDKYFRYQMLVLTFRGQEGAAEHKHMLEAALARDATRAQEILEAHIRGGLTHSMSVFQAEATV